MCSSAKLYHGAKYRYHCQFCSHCLYAQAPPKTPASYDRKQASPMHPTAPYTCSSGSAGRQRGGSSGVLRVHFLAHQPLLRITDTHDSVFHKPQNKGQVAPLLLGAQRQGVEFTHVRVHMGLSLIFHAPSSIRSHGSAQPAGRLVLRRGIQSTTAGRKGRDTPLIRRSGENILRKFYEPPSFPPFLPLPSFVREKKSRENGFCLPCKRKAPAGSGKQDCAGAVTTPLKLGRGCEDDAGFPPQQKG